MDCTVAILKDDASEIETAFERHTKSHDLIMTVGGTGMSSRDHVVPVLNHLGWTGVFRGVRMAPGKGALFGLIDETPVFGLPGGPPSSEMAFLELGLPLISKLAGDPAINLPQVAVKLGHALDGELGGVDTFIKMTLRDVDGELVARLGGVGDEGAVSPAICVVRVPAKHGRLERHSTVDARLIS